MARIGASGVAQHDVRIAADGDAFNALGMTMAESERESLGAGRSDVELKPATAGIANLDAAGARRLNATNGGLGEST
jgi:hypothetical protein